MIDQDDWDVSSESNRAILFRGLLKERDEALAKANAYREVAYEFCNGHRISQIDEAAQKIMAGREGI
jgi:hypothetical protein